MFVDSSRLAPLLIGSDNAHRSIGLEDLALAGRREFRLTDTAAQSVERVGE
jgi:hypothetical protein